MRAKCAVISRSEAQHCAPPLALQRTRGAARIRFKQAEGRTALERLFQEGATKVRLPRTEPGEPPQAILMNNAGGLTGGDRLSIEVEIGSGGRAIISTPSCERIYRSLSGEAEIATTVRVEDSARLDWLPQETILFDGARLSRSFDLEVGNDAEFLAVEAIVFGRIASGERVGSGLFRDRWRIRRGGRLVLADDVRLDWADQCLLRRPAVLAGYAALATVFYLGPEPERHVEPLRRILGDAGGVSAWDGKLVARLVAEDGAALRRLLPPMLNACLAGAALPNIWRN